MKNSGVTELTDATQPGVDALKFWLVRELALALDIAQEAVPANEPFSQFGLDSAKAVKLVYRLGEYLGRKIPVPVVWNHPTIEALSNYLCGNAKTASKDFSLRSHTATLNESIAVIGMACRFPGAPDLEAFWRMLQSGAAAIREITPNRWDVNSWYDPDPGTKGKMNARKAGLLESIDRFDAGFFGISPREAVEMDPQQRLALELSWEALENAGVKPSSLRGSCTGVFVGVVWHDYEMIARKAGAEIGAYSGTGQCFSVIANRVSYALGLQGPSIALDTACSSSLVSVHLACRSLQCGDASLAIAGGVNIIAAPETMVALSKFGALSPTSQLCAFDARANGFVRGEGGGFVVLKPLSRALADGDPVYAVIRGSAVNNDGASNGLTAPNPQAQEAVLREAYRRAGMSPAAVQYIEAHGTGTPLGDPIEAHALGSVFASERSGDQPLLIGSVKTNVGHLEGAAGIAGLIKLILSIQHRLIPPSLNFETPNPHIDFAGSKLRVVTELEAWPPAAKPALGGISAFGWGGTNCHIVVQEADRSTAHLLPLSAPDLETLRATAGQLRGYLNAALPAHDLRDICAGAAARCAGQMERLALTARSVGELSAQLEGFLLGQKRPGLAAGRITTPRPKLAFIFAPQGPQWLGMGRSLIAFEPVFRTKLAQCDRTLVKIAGWSLFDELLAAPGESRLNRAEYVQPALTAIEIAVAGLLISWGVRPDFIAGHSLGEWAAACVAGALSIEETMRLAVASSRAQAQAGEGGGMAVVELPETKVTERIESWSREVCVAGSNSPTSTILSGDAAILKHLVTTWKEEGIMCSLIDVDVAAHSARMDPVLGALKASLQDLHPTRTAIPFISSVCGSYLQGTEMGPEHWARHLCQPVLFSDVVERLARDGCALFLEISPHPVLTGGIEQTLARSGTRGIALGSCRRGDDERGSLLNTLGTLYALGWPIQWSAVAGGGRNDLALPIPTAQVQAPTPRPSKPEEPVLVPLSGHTAEALRDRVLSVACHLRTRRDLSANDIFYTAAGRRDHHNYRLAVVATGREELASALEAFANNLDAANLAGGNIRANRVSRVGFICSGQGAQWWGMGRELLETSTVFRRVIARCADEIKRYASWDLLEELARDEAGTRLGETEIAQPALFALQVALAEVWRCWGVEPAALVGHSVGEVAAAYLGGVLSFDDAIKVIWHRGRLMQATTGLGRMAAIELPEQEIEKWLAAHRDCVSVAAINSPTSIVIAGDATALSEIVSAARIRGVRGTILPVNYAFHSPQMEPFAALMEEAVSGLQTRQALIPVYSTMTGAQSTNAEFTAGYWGRNIRQPVRFAASIRAMLESGITTFVELSPHPVLSSMVFECATALGRTVESLSSLRRGRPERHQMLKSLSTLFVAGADIDWPEIYQEGGRVAPLPVYPWQRKRYWLNTGPAAAPDINSLPAEAPADWYYDVVWEEKPRPDPSVRGVGRRLPSPKDLKTGIEARLGALAIETRHVHGVEARAEIETLAVDFATAALIRLGLEFSPHRRFTAATLSEQLGIQKSHAWLFARMLDMLAEKGLLSQVGAQFETAAAYQTVAASLHSLADRTTSLRRKHADFATEFELLARCGGLLPEVLQGRVNALEVLFPLDGSVSAERLYRDSPSARFYNRLAGELVGNAVREASNQHPVHLLELGAGTGSTTACVLERLTEARATYCFTDISRSLLQEAHSKFHHFPALRYEILNIEKPPDTGKFNVGGYDVVLAANVLHATTDLRTALKHVRRLLSPGGLLVLMETTAPRCWLDLIFGLTSGWSRFTDTELRAKSALLDTRNWLSLLNDSGFHATTVVGEEFSAGDPHEQAILIARPDQVSAGKVKPDRRETLPQSFARGRWLIFSDAMGLADQVARRLEEGGGECVLVHTGGTFEETNLHRRTIDIEKSEHYRRLLDEGTSWRGILHCWTLDATFEEANALADLNRAERLGCRSLFFLSQAIAGMPVSQLPKLWILTRGAQPAWPHKKLAAIAQTPVWGLGRTLALEHPDFWGGIIDVAAGSDPQVVANRIALEICFPDGEDQIALSADLRLVPRLLATQPPSPVPVRIRPDASYLITGGLGGLGPHIARWLVRSGARHLILCSRRKLPDRSTWGKILPSHESCQQVAAIQELEKQGATIEVASVDVADRGQMEALFARVRNSSTPLAGIIHAAADIQFCSIQEMSPAALHATMRAKVEGAWLLHELSRTIPLDFFVLFSSATALFGASRIAHYAASNQFLDFLAHWRREAGLPALSINWGAWEEIRLLGENRDQVERFGLKAMPAELALRALSFLTTGDVPQRMVADIDWAVLVRAFETRGRRSFFEHLDLLTTAERAADTVGSDWLKRFDAIATEDRREFVSTLVAQETRLILGLSADEPFDFDRGLFEIGMDSLMSVKLKGRLEKTIGCGLPATLTFTYPTVNALTDFLLGEVLESSTEVIDVAQDSAINEGQPADENLSELSDDQIEDLLKAELTSLALNRSDCGAEGSRNAVL